MASIHKLIATAVAGIAFVAQASAQQIIVPTGDTLTVSRANPGKGYRDAMVQTIILRNDSASAVTLDNVAISVVGTKGESLVRTVLPETVLAQTQSFSEMARAGMSIFLNAQILDAAGLDHAFGEGSRLATSATLAPGELAILTSQYLAFGFESATIHIDASFKTGTGKRKVRLNIRPDTAEPSSDYTSPVNGTWMVRGLANLDSHHRFIPSNEFAIDFFKAGPDAALDQGDRSSPADDYGYGDPVHAVADGEIVAVRADQVQDQDALTKRPDESVDAARARISRNQMARYAGDFRAAAAGNLITIKHVTATGVAYSSYGHLKPGTIRVKVGDRVARGASIGAVGNTGDSTLTHLHFQMNAGPDPFFSRSLPVRFDNEKSLYGGQDLGLVKIFGP